MPQEYVKNTKNIIFMEWVFKPRILVIQFAACLFILKNNMKT